MGFLALILLLEGTGGSLGKLRVPQLEQEQAAVVVGPTWEHRSLKPPMGHSLNQGSAHELNLTWRAWREPNQHLSCPAPGLNPTREGFT